MKQLDQQNRVLQIMKELSDAKAQLERVRLDQEAALKKVAKAKKDLDDAPRVPLAPDVPNLCELLKEDELNGHLNSKGAQQLELIC